MSTAAARVKSLALGVLWDSTAGCGILPSYAALTQLRLRAAGGHVLPGCAAPHLGVVDAAVLCGPAQIDSHVAQSGPEPGAGAPFARDQSHRLVTLEHLLLALTEDAEAALILQSANVDLARLGTDVSGYLGRLLEDMRAEPGTEPRPDAELLRVLQAAASAAQQSRRKQIDGAIVLAAIVGDGKSPAAGLLKAHGHDLRGGHPRPAARQYARRG